MMNLRDENADHQQKISELENQVEKNDKEIEELNEDIN